MVNKDNDLLEELIDSVIVMGICTDQSDAEIIKLINEIKEVYESN